MPETEARRRTPEAAERPLRREVSYGFDDLEEDEGGYGRRRKAGVRVTFRGGLPRTVWGRVASGAAVAALLGAFAAGVWMVRDYVLHDPRFVLPGRSSVQVEGDHHLNPEELQGVFGADIGRNIFRVSLDDRQLALEDLPWVKHATVMRLLPNRMRVEITERTPVAFVRQGSHVGLVDAGGVLLEMSGGQRAGGSPYSFPVVTGILPADPISVRDARMKIFEEFTADLDSTGEKISARLSEVDLSNPEDVKALIPDKGSDVLVHFGESDYLQRYRKYEEHLPEWRSQYPKLSSVDMRYERQVVLEMQPGTPVPVPGAATGAAAAAAAEPGKGVTAVAHASAAPAVRAAKPAPLKRAAPRPVGAAVPGKARAVPNVAGAKKKPELVGSWTSDGKYHPPPGAKP